MKTKLKKDIEIDVIIPFFLPESENPACIGEKIICKDKNKNNKIFAMKWLCSSFIITIKFSHIMSEKINKSIINNIFIVFLFFINRIETFSVLVFHFMYNTFTNIVKSE